MLKARIITALVALAVLLLVLFVAPPRVGEAACAALAIAGAWEWTTLLGLTSTLTRSVYVVFIAALLAAAFGYIGVAGETILLAALIWWAAAATWVVLYPTRVPPAVVWLAGIFVLVPLFTALVLLFRSGAANLFFVLLVVWAADIGAYFTGRQFGRVKLAPAISPGKTWEGVIGGLVAVTLLTSAAAIYWFDIGLMTLLPFCLAAASISIVGDLTISIFKRNAGVKDSGSLFPGHGGVLDRVDSVSAAAPVFALGMAWAGLL